MIKIKNVTMKNFLSVGNATQAVDLSSEALTLVLGSATDLNGAPTRNGAGKSTLCQAICYALYGKPLTKIKLPNLINNINSKGLVVTLTFEKGDKTYRIERGQKPAFMKFFVNDKEIQTETDQAQGENRRTQEDIERLIGMSHSLFKHLVALNTFTEPFLRMSVGDQRGVIEELLGVTQLSEKAEILKRLIGDTKDAIKTEEANVRATQEANARIEKTIEKTRVQSSAWERRHAEEIARIEGEIEALSSIDFDAELVLLDALDAWRTTKSDLDHRLNVERSHRKTLTATVKAEQARLSRLEKEAQRLESGDQIARLDAEIGRKKADLIDQDGYLRDLSEKITALDAPVEAGKCGYCGQTIDTPEHKARVLIEKQKARAALDKDIAKVEARKVRFSEEIAQIEAERDTVTASRDGDIARIARESEECGRELQKAEQALEKLAQAERDLTVQIEALGSKPEPIFDTRDQFYEAKQVRDLLAKELENEIAKTNPFQEQIATLAATLVSVSYETLNELNDLHKHQDTLLRLLVNKDSFIRKKIIDQNLFYLNTRLNHYLDKLGLPHEVRFSPDLSVDIVKLGRDFDFEQLSRGEMNRVIMATSWAFRDIWESLNEKINLLFVDEMIDNGTDQQGAEAALDVLKTMSRNGKNVFLISHKDDLISRIPRTLLVEKVDDFSSFKLDAL